MDNVHISNLPKISEKIADQFSSFRFLKLLPTSDWSLLSQMMGIWKIVDVLMLLEASYGSNFVRWYWTDSKTQNKRGTHAS